MVGSVLGGTVVGSIGGRFGALPCVQKVAGSNPTLTAT